MPRAHLWFLSSLVCECVTNLTYQSSPAITWDGFESSSASDLMVLAHHSCHSFLAQGWTIKNNIWCEHGCQLVWRQWRCLNDRHVRVSVAMMTLRVCSSLHATSKCRWVRSICTHPNCHARGDCGGFILWRVYHYQHRDHCCNVCDGTMYTPRQAFLHSLTATFKMPFLSSLVRVIRR